MGKTTLILMIITFISKITGLLREQVFAYFLGTGDVIDAFNTASTIPFMLFGSLLMSIIAGYIPVYSEIKTKKGKESADKFTSNLLNILVILACIFIALIILASPLLVKLFAPGYSSEKESLSIKFTIIFAFTLIPTIISSIFIGYLQMRNRFLISETPGILMNVFHIITIVMAVHFNNYFLIPIGVLISEFCKYSLFPMTIKEEHYKHSFFIDFKDKYIHKILKFAIPLFISISAMDILALSDQSLASIIKPMGGVSVLKYSILIFQLVVGIIIVSVVTSTYPLISSYASERKYKKMKKTIIDGLSLSYSLVIPAMIGIIILAEPLIKILFQRGNFTYEDTLITASVLTFYMPSILGFTVKEIINRGFYATQNTKIPIIVTVIQVILNIILNFVLSKFIGLKGLALATTISSIIAAILSLYFFRLKYGNLNLLSFSKNLIKLSIASAIMGIFTYMIYNILSSVNYILALSLSIIISIIIYGIIIVFMRIPEVMKFINKIYYKFKR